MKSRLEISKETLDASLPPMSKSYENRANLLLGQLTSKQEEPIVKKKLSVSLVLALILVCALAVAAVAATILWENYAPTVKQMEHEQGAYATWHAKDKIELIKVLVDNGDMPASEETRRLFDETTSEDEVHRIADALLMNLTQAENVDEINLDVITYAIMGFFETWTPEQRVWWQEITNTYRDPNMIETDTFVRSNEDDLPEAEAIRIAKEAIINAYQLPEGSLDGHVNVVADMYVTENRPDYRRWIVSFQMLREGDDAYVERQYSAIVDNTGEVIADPDIGEPHVQDGAASFAELNRQRTQREKDPVIIALQAFYDKYDFNYSFPQLSLEAKAEFSKNIRPLILEAIETNNEVYGENYEWLPIDYTTYVYGLPGNEHISEEKALSLAKEKIIAECAIDTVVLEKYVPFTYFDITDQDKPLWKFFFSSKASDYDFFSSLPEGSWDWGYKVEINAVDGTIQTFIIDNEIADDPHTQAIKLL